MKKRIVKLAAAVVTLAMGMAVMSGCGSESNELIMGTNAAFPPFEFTSSDGIVEGFDGIDVAISKKIAENMGKELKVEDMEFEGLVASVKTGKVDMAVAGMTITEEKAKSVDFSDTYYTASQIIVTSKDNTDITKAEDLKNDKNVGVVLGYTGDTIVTETLALPEEKITRTNRGIDGVMDVKNGKLDAFVIDKATGIALAEKNDLKVVEDAEVFETEEYAIAVKKGNTELLEQINSTLSEMKESGEIDQLAQKYMAE